MRESILKQIIEMVEMGTETGDQSKKGTKNEFQSVQQKLKDLNQSGNLTALDMAVWKHRFQSSSVPPTEDDQRQWARLLQYWKENPALRSIHHGLGIGPSRQKIFAGMGIYSLRDLLTYFPKRYEDRSRIVTIGEVSDGDIATVIGTVVNVSEQRTRGRMRLLKVTVQDDSGVMQAVWFNQPFLKQQMKKGRELIFSGKAQYRFGQMQMANPTWENHEQDETTHSGRIVPVYSLVDAMPQKVMRRIMMHNVDREASRWQFWVPDKYRRKHQLPDGQEALRNIHFPEDDTAQKKARRFLVYEELFLLQLYIQLQRKNYQTQFSGISQPLQKKFFDRFLNLLPFQLTEAQSRVIREIFEDMEKPEPMNRLLQGDVGSGKTLVAAAALINAAANGYQGVMMVPTEILAEQHFLKLHPYFDHLGIRCRLLTGGMRRQDKQALHYAISQGEVDTVIGTHALLQDPVAFPKLSLVITDEQHRFGVGQRSVLQNKGESPDVLVMSATPIPRTMTLTIFGDLDVSTIDQMPPGRQIIKTYRANTSMRPRVYRFVHQQVEEGRQAYIVCPLVEESEKLQTESAVETAERLKSGEFSDLQVGLVHGRMSAEEKESTMTMFRQGDIDVLVATTVIEVGVDVPNAAVMVIEGADRFGLSQLHQLRGRVGRGSHESYCILVADAENDSGNDRLDVLCRFHDGFRIAEEDLRIRGAGEYLGRRQHGAGNLKIADLLQDHAAMEIARQDAIEIVNNEMDAMEKEFPTIHEELLYRFGSEEDIASLT